MSTEPAENNPLDRQDAIVDTETLVCLDIYSRQQRGVSKYGTTVALNRLSLMEWLQHGYEEALDLAVYLKRTMQELERREKP